MNTEFNTGNISYLESSGQRLAIQHNELVGTLSSEPPLLPVPHIVFCSGFHSSMQGSKAQALAEFCTTSGWPYSRFDYRGHGDSEGEAHAFNLHDWLSDTLLVLDQCDCPVVLVGSSMGAWLATLAALQRTTRVKGLLLLAAAPDFLQELIAPNLTPADSWDLQQGQVVSLPNDYESGFALTQSLLDSGIDLTLLKGDALKTLTCPVRLVHGTADTDVPFDLSVRLMDKITHSNAQLTLLHQADHRLSDERCLAHIKKELNDLLATLPR